MERVLMGIIITAMLVSVVSTIPIIIYREREKTLLLRILPVVSGAMSLAIGWMALMLHSDIKRGDILACGIFLLVLGLGHLVISFIPKYNKVLVKEENIKIEKKKMKEEKQYLKLKEEISKINSSTKEEYIELSKRIQSLEQMIDKLLKKGSLQETQIKREEPDKEKQHNELLKRVQSLEKTIENLLSSGVLKETQIKWEELDEEKQKQFIDTAIRKYYLAQLADDRFEISRQQKALMKQSLESGEFFIEDLSADEQKQIQKSAKNIYENQEYEEINSRESKKSNTDSKGSKKSMLKKALIITPCVWLGVMIIGFIISACLPLESQIAFTLAWQVIFWFALTPATWITEVVLGIILYVKFYKKTANAIDSYLKNNRF